MRLGLFSNPSSSFVWVLQRFPRCVPGPKRTLLTLNSFQAGPPGVFHASRACLTQRPLPCGFHRWPVPLVHFPPSGFCTSHQVDHRCRRLPLLPLNHCWFPASEVSSLLEVCLPVVVKQLSGLYPLGCWLFRDFPSPGASLPLPADSLPSVLTA